MINVSSKEEIPKAGLYRHFKGSYYFLQNIIIECDEKGENRKCLYFNIEHPEYGTFTRSIEQWFTDVSERLDNVTKQKTRFVRVDNLDFQLSSVPTDVLLDELSKRADSPLKNFNIEGLKNSIEVQDYVVGLLCDKVDYDRGISVVNAFPQLEQAQHYIDHNRTMSGTKVYERTYVEVKR